MNVLRCGPFVTFIQQPLSKFTSRPCNLHAQQNFSQFQTNGEEMKAFLGIDSVITVNTLATITSYWECRQYIGT